LGVVGGWHCRGCRTGESDAPSIGAPARVGAAVGAAVGSAAVESPRPGSTDFGSPAVGSAFETLVVAADVSVPGLQAASPSSERESKRVVEVSLAISNSLSRVCGA
jgi:hypothetical protein